MPAVIARRPDAIGFLGSDTFDELPSNLRDRMVFYPAAQTEIRFALCAPESEAANVRQAIEERGCLTVASSYPNQTRRIADELGLKLPKIVELGGSVEAAPYILEGVDAIVDVVDSGRTLEENGLSIIVDNLGRLAIGAIWSTEETQR